MKDLEELWQRQSATGAAVTTQAVTAASARFARRVALRNAREWVAAALVMAIFGWRAWTSPLLLVRAGAALTVMAAVFVTLVLARRGRVVEAPRPDAPTSEHIAHQRRELLRQQRLLAWAWAWYILPFVPGLALMLAGMGRVVPGPALFAACVCASVLVVIAVLNRRAARKLGDAASGLEV